jgi:hypothetical protein
MCASKGLPRKAVHVSTSPFGIRSARYESVRARTRLPPSLPERLSRHFSTDACTPPLFFIFNHVNRLWRTGAQRMLGVIRLDQPIGHDGGLQRTTLDNRLARWISEEEPSFPVQEEQWSTAGVFSLGGRAARDARGEQ